MPTKSFSVRIVCVLIKYVASSPTNGVCDVFVLVFDFINKKFLNFLKTDKMKKAKHTSDSHSHLRIVDRRKWCPMQCENSFVVTLIVLFVSEPIQLIISTNKFQSNGLFAFWSVL